MAPVERVTGGLLNSNLLVNLVLFAIVVGGVMWGLARLRPRDVGVRREQVLPGALGALAFWGSVQLILLLHGLVSGAEISLSTRWTGGAFAVIVGALLTQILGTALREELVYRGFLIPQLHRYLRTGIRRPRLALALAVIIASLAFALMHVPNVLRLGFSPAPQFFIHTVSGLTYSLLYVFSGNLFFVIGVHGLGNWGMPLLDTGLDAGMVTFLLRIVLVFALGLIRTRSADPRAAHRSSRAL